MRTPSDNKAGAKDKATPGGKAYQRVQQDRAARGLDPLPPPSAPIVTDTKSPAKKKSKGA